jgi:hypothetical protein
MAPGPAGRPPGWPARLRRVALFAGVLLLIPAVISFVVTMTGGSNTAFSIRAVEWMRDHGARGLVNTVENEYYSLTAPAPGGPGLKALPRQPGVAASPRRAPSRTTAPPPYLPPAIVPVMHPALPGEGVWRVTFAPAGAADPPVLVTSFRPDPNYPRVVAGVAWINASRSTVQLYPGVQEPAVPMPGRGPEEVPLALRSRLVATFNSAFKLADSGGGFVYGGRTYAPMHDGLATIVRYRDGRVDVVPWTGGPVAGTDVVYARQNLPLIVEAGHPNPNLSDGPEWGATLGNAVRVWRSAVGVDAHGDLIYAAADDQTVGSLAQILVHAGAVRAMELDINAYWPSFITYTGPGAVGAANLLPDMQRSPQRYLTPDDRDFFAVYLR